MTSLLVSPPISTKLHAPTIHRLPNGLTIIAEQMPVEAVNLSLWLRVGSAVEPDDINGMAHFLEHMVFKGTQTLQSGEFERWIEARGAITNAATSHDYTQYYITTAPQDFADLAPLQMDVVLNASIPDDGFERERFVVLEEIRRSQDNPRRRSYQRMSDLAFEHLPYRRQVLGPAAVIENLAPQQMRDFHQTWYHPQSVTAVAVGNLPVDELIRIIAESCPSGSSPAESNRAGGGAPAMAPAVLPAEVPFTGITRCEYTDPTLQQARLMMVWRVPGMTDLAQTYALDVLASILSHGRTTRLVKDLREDRGLVTSIAASNMTYQHQGIFCVSAQLPLANVPAVEAAIVQHMRMIQTASITSAEMARVRSQVANHFIFGNETPSDRANLYGYYYSLLGDLTPALNYPETIQALTDTALQAAAQQYLPADRYGIVVIKPE
jgi:zinc protease